ncbi:hypothetical protein KIPB_003992 [Kipferlia bialata]|uniref:Uncharacterized protein n=1 Tax=Kipferlia bialata TaxID=797122 RepID=A0A9K3CUM9_9EUKA|nr:hypothetical protein KIPB_003992 [Kipferlia bialata]|eukprot:g3992.t1
MNRSGSFAPTRSAATLLKPGDPRGASQARSPSQARVSPGQVRMSPQQMYSSNARRSPSVHSSVSVGRAPVHSVPLASWGEEEVVEPRPKASKRTIYIMIACIPVLLWAYIFLFSGLGITFFGIINQRSVVQQEVGTTTSTTTSISASGEVSMTSLHIELADKADTSSAYAKGESGTEGEGRAYGQSDYAPGYVAPKIASDVDEFVIGESDESGYDVDMEARNRDVLSLSSSDALFHSEVAVEGAVTAESLTLSSLSCQTVSSAVVVSSNTQEMSYSLPVSFEAEVTFSEAPDLEVDELRSTEGSSVTLESGGVAMAASASGSVSVTVGSGEDLVVGATGGSASVAVSLTAGADLTVEASSGLVDIASDETSGAITVTADDIVFTGDVAFEGGISYPDRVDETTTLSTSQSVTTPLISPVADGSSGTLSVAAASTIELVGDIIMENEVEVSGELSMRSGMTEADGALETSVVDDVTLQYAFNDASYSNYRIEVPDSTGAYIHMQGTGYEYVSGTDSEPASVTVGVDRATLVATGLAGGDDVVIRGGEGNGTVSTASDYVTPGSVSIGATSDHVELGAVGKSVEVQGDLYVEGSITISTGLTFGDADATDYVLQREANTGGDGGDFELRSGDGSTGGSDLYLAGGRLQTSSGLSSNGSIMIGRSADTGRAEAPSVVIGNSDTPVTISGALTTASITLAPSAAPEAVVVEPTASADSTVPILISGQTASQGSGSTDGGDVLLAAGAGVSGGSVSLDGETVQIGTLNGDTVEIGVAGSGTETSLSVAADVTVASTQGVTVSGTVDITSLTTSGAETASIVSPAPEAEDTTVTILTIEGVSSPSESDEKGGSVLINGGDKVGTGVYDGRVIVNVPTDDIPLNADRTENVIMGGEATMTGDVSIEATDAVVDGDATLGSLSVTTTGGSLLIQATSTETDSPSLTISGGMGADTTGPDVFGDGGDLVFLAGTATASGRLQLDTGDAVDCDAVTDLASTEIVIGVGADSVAIGYIEGVGAEDHRTSLAIDAAVTVAELASVTFEPSEILIGSRDQSSTPSDTDTFPVTVSRVTMPNDTTGALITTDQYAPSTRFEGASQLPSDLVTDPASGMSTGGDLIIAGGDGDAGGSVTIAAGNTVYPVDASGNYVAPDIPDDAVVDKLVDGSIYLGALSTSTFDSTSVIINADTVVGAEFELSVKTLSGNDSEESVEAAAISLDAFGTSATVSIATDVNTASLVIGATGVPTSVMGDVEVAVDTVLEGDVVIGDADVIALTVSPTTPSIDGSGPVTLLTASFTDSDTAGDISIVPGATVDRDSTNGDTTTQAGVHVGSATSETPLDVHGEGTFVGAATLKGSVAFEDSVELQAIETLTFDADSVLTDADVHDDTLLVTESPFVFDGAQTVAIDTAAATYKDAADVLINPQDSTIGIGGNAASVSFDSPLSVSLTADLQTVAVEGTLEVTGSLTMPLTPVTSEAAVSLTIEQDDNADATIYVDSADLGLEATDYGTHDIVLTGGLTTSESAAGGRVILLGGASSGNEDDSLDDWTGASIKVNAYKPLANSMSSDIIIAGGDGSTTDSDELGAVWVYPGEDSRDITIGGCEDEANTVCGTTYVHASGLYTHSQMVFGDEDPDGNSFDLRGTVTGNLDVEAAGSPSLTLSGNNDGGDPITLAEVEYTNILIAGADVSVWGNDTSGSIRLTTSSTFVGETDTEERYVPEVQMDTLRLRMDGTNDVGYIRPGTPGTSMTTDQAWPTKCNPFISVDITGWADGDDTDMLGCFVNHADTTTSCSTGDLFYTMAPNFQNSGNLTPTLMTCMEVDVQVNGVDYTHRTYFVAVGKESEFFDTLLNGLAMSYKLYFDGEENTDAP